MIFLIRRLEGSTAAVLQIRASLQQRQPSPAPATTPVEPKTVARTEPLPLREVARLQDRSEQFRGIKLDVTG